MGIKGGRDRRRERKRGRKEEEGREKEREKEKEESNLEKRNLKNISKVSVSKLAKQPLKLYSFL